MSSNQLKSNSASIDSSSTQTKEESLETWFIKMGYNPEDPQRMKEILNLIQSDSRIAFSFQHLKKHVRPVEEVKKIRKIYLYRIIINGRFNFDISEYYAIRGKSDVDMCVSYEKSEWRSKALEMIKNKEGMKTMEDLQTKSGFLVNEYDKIMSDFLEKSEIVYDLRQLKSSLTIINDSWISLKNLSDVLHGKKKGPKDFQRFIKESYGSSSIINLNKFPKIPLSMDKLNALITEYKLVESEFKSLNPYNLLSTITEETLLKGSTDKIYLKTFLNIYFENNLHLLDLLGRSFNCLDNFKNKSNSFDDEITKNLFDYHNKTIEINDKVKYFLNKPSKKVEKIKNLKTFMGDDNYLSADTILRKWGTSLESSDLMSVLANKRRQLEFYRTIKSSNINIDETEVFSLLWLSSEFVYEDIVKENTEICKKLKENQSNIKQLEIKMFETIKKMPFVKLNDKSITEVLDRIKLGLIESQRLMLLKF